MTMYNVAVSTERSNGQWSSSISSPTFVLDSDTQGIVSAEHAEKIVRHWMTDLGLTVLSVSVSARPAEKVLSRFDALAIAAIVTAASDGAKVAYVNNDGDIIYGIARHVVTSPDNFGFLDSATDVRDGYLRITTKGGWELAPSMADLITAYAENRFSVYDW